MKKETLIQEINSLKLLIEELKKSLEELKNIPCTHYHYHYEKQTITQPYNPNITPYFNPQSGGTGIVGNINVPSNTNNNPYNIPATNTVTNYTLKPGDSLTFTDSNGNSKTLGFIKVVQKPDFNMN